MENPFANLEPQLNGEATGLRKANANDPAEKLLAEAFARPKTNHTTLEDEVLFAKTRPSLSEELVVKTAMGAAIGGTTGYGMSILGSNLRDTLSLGLHGGASESAARMSAHAGVLRGAAIAGVMTGINYALDETVRSHDPESKSWMSLAPSVQAPYRSSIFAPTLIESVGYGLAGGLRGAPLAGVVATSWVVGRAANYLTTKV